MLEWDQVGTRCNMVKLRSSKYQVLYSHGGGQVSIYCVIHYIHRPVCVD